MTVFCLVELDGGTGDGGAAGVADVSLRAITLARGLAASGGIAAVVFGDSPVSDLAAYGVTDVYAVAGTHARRIGSTQIYGLTSEAFFRNPGTLDALQ